MDFGMRDLVDGLGAGIRRFAGWALVVGVVLAIVLLACGAAVLARPVDSSHIGCSAGEAAATGDAHGIDARGPRARA